MRHEGGAKAQRFVIVYVARCSVVVPGSGSMYN